MTTPPASPPPDNRLISGLALTGTYVVLGVWTWLAWYKDKPRLPHPRYGGDGFLGEATYAGGADKWGHLWTNLLLSRLGTKLLQHGGWSRSSASLFASGVCTTAFLLVEVNDASYTEFSPGDLAANLIGAVVAVGMDHWPVIDQTVDLRVQWFPSVHFRRDPGVNFAEDYSGQTYLLAFKPGGIDAVGATNTAASWLRFINPVLGFAARNYIPVPLPTERATRQRSIFLGVTVDMQAVVEATLGERDSTAARIMHDVGHELFEFVNLPFSTMRLLQVSHSNLMTTR